MRRTFIADAQVIVYLHATRPILRIITSTSSGEKR